ncbi:Phage QLRG family, putative DNA packaging [Bradyrhizobium sp. YR681]|uniref:phage head-tail connector protein n=1 Tax=Bradyrhizobium sp. YR681 TaxID=1144344 RepID=UPI000271148E|nr:phage head-tail connector protein [Bradyrhizobium sp. YR681]EJN11850.1 Phage QLRG family, putative DNA packaging [Bradyrhizobium sp. YR681]
MRSIVIVASPASDTALTTLERVKLELDISSGDTSNDTVLQEKIDEASDDIEASLGFRLVRESAVETFWHEQYDNAPEKLVLDRTPVASIASVIVDGVTVDPSAYRYDPNTGELFALCNGYPHVWIFCQSVVVTYDGGYILPGASNRTLPKGIEGACVALVSSFWAAKGRDPTKKSEDVPGVGRVEYWVGTVGEAGELPPDIVARLAPFRRPVVA